MLATLSGIEKGGTQVRVLGTLYLTRRSQTVDISCLRLTRAGHNLLTTDTPRYTGPPYDVLG